MRCRGKDGYQRRRALLLAEVRRHPEFPTLCCLICWHCQRAFGSYIMGRVNRTRLASFSSISAFVSATRFSEFGITLILLAWGSRTASSKTVATLLVGAVRAADPFLSVRLSSWQITVAWRCGAPLRIRLAYGQLSRLNMSLYWGDVHFECKTRNSIDLLSRYSLVWSCVSCTFAPASDQDSWRSGIFRAI